MNDRLHNGAVASVLTVPELARELRISRNAAYDLVAAGTLRSLRLGRSIRVPRSEVERLVADRPIPTEGTAPKGATTPEESWTFDELDDLQPATGRPEGLPSALLYRCYSRKLELLYVGTTTQGQRRLLQHAEKGWFEREVSVVTFERIPPRDAKRLEALAIQSERPRYNIHHRKER